MTADGIELAFTVSARELDNVRSMLSSKQLFRNCPVMTYLCLRILFIALIPFDWMGMLLDRVGPAKRGQEDVHWGPQQMIAGPEDLTVRRAAHTAVYRWAAIRELRKTRTMILLMLTSVHTVPVPRRAFANRADEKRFCDFVRGRIAEAVTSSQESPLPGRGAPSRI
jgi:hypothetical protein